MFGSGFAGVYESPTPLKLWVQIWWATTKQCPKTRHHKQAGPAK